MGTSRKFKKKSRKRFFSKNRHSRSKYKKFKYLVKKTKKRGRNMTGGDINDDCCRHCGRGPIAPKYENFCNFFCGPTPCDPI